MTPSTRSSISREEFAAWYHALNREFPTFGPRSTEDLEAQQEQWFRTLSHFTREELYRAWTTWLDTNTNRPKLAHMRQECLKACAVIRRVQLRSDEWPDVNVCPCGCGGERWGRALVTAAGELRTGIVGNGGEVGVLSRDMLECRATNTQPRPASLPVATDWRGVKIYRVS